MSRVRTASVLGVATGALGVLLSLIPPISSLEDTLGLRALFRIRGQLPAPQGVVVVSIDRPAGVALGLPQQVRDWPRAYHARLIDRLVEHGASVIAFDLQFFRETPDDEQLAAAIGRAKRVVLVQWLEDVPGAGSMYRDPIPPFANVAAAVAPVPIPDTPLVSWFWTFVTATGGADVPTFPAVVMQVGGAAARTALLTALKSIGIVTRSDDPVASMRELRQALNGNADALSQIRAHLSTQRIDSVTRRRAERMADLYVRDAAAYLNFYGPPGGVCTVSYDVVVQGSSSPCPLKDAAVFVGVGHSRLDRAEQIDTYHTIYENSDGVDFSGVELHATALANLLDGTALRPVSAVVILFGIGFVLAGSGYWIRTRRRWLRGSVAARVEAAVVVTVLIGAYCIVAFVLFASYHLIVPLIVPLAMQFPEALILALLARPTVREERVHAVCVVADAAGSTAVGQRLPHDAYAALMTGYSHVLSRCVTARGGLPLAPHGDGFASLWLLKARAEDGDNISVRRAACASALEMVEAADQFNDSRPDHERLPLRVGLTIGAVTVRSDADRGAFEAVGDAVNIAARLEGLNRELATRVLASEDVVAGMEGQFELTLIDRNVTLKGIAAAPCVFEVAARTGPALRTPSVDRVSKL
jgi:adenylate cyclase